MLHSNAMLLFYKVVKDDDDDDINSISGKLGSKTPKKTFYIIHQRYIDEHIAAEASSSTFLTLLATLSPKLNKKLSLLIGNIVTSAFKNQATVFTPGYKPTSSP